MATYFKVGDKVTVRSDLKDGKTCFMSDGMVSDVFVSSMERLCGQQVTIESAGAKYRIAEFGANWTDEMFEEYAFRDLPWLNKELSPATDEEWMHLFMS